jgi:hypothetical protein
MPPTVGSQVGMNLIQRKVSRAAIYPEAVDKFVAILPKINPAETLAFMNVARLSTIEVE